MACARDCESPGAPCCVHEAGDGPTKIALGLDVPEPALLDERHMAARRRRAARLERAQDVVHVHLRHFSHDKDFFRLLSKVMPDWRDREQQLRD